MHTTRTHQAPAPAEEVAKPAEEPKATEEAPAPAAEEAKPAEAAAPAAEAPAPAAGDRLSLFISSTRALLSNFL